MGKHVLCELEPAGLRRAQAASYCGVSASHFDRMVDGGVLPKPRPLGGVNIWLRRELDEALFAITPTGESGENSCDRAFGLE